MRHEDSLKWVNEEISECARDGHVEVNIHVTRTPDIPPQDGGKGSQDGRSEIGKQIDESKIELERNLNVVKYINITGRPCLTKLITEYAVETGASLAVLACGPETFLDETRKTISDNVVMTNGTLDYFEEALTW